MRKIEIYTNDCEMKLKTDGSQAGEQAVTAALTSLAHSIGEITFVSITKGKPQTWHSATIKNNNLLIKRRH